MIELSISDAVAVVTLGRPAKLNALTLSMRADLRDIFKDLSTNGSVRAVVLTGTGRGFCAGADIAELEGNDTRLDFETITNPMILNIHALGKPVICAVNGLATGLGWSLALASDIVIAGESARFSQIFRRVGLIPDGGAMWFLNRLIGPMRAKDLIYSARFVDAREALDLGLVSEVVEDGRLSERSLSIARDLATGPTLAFGLAKKLFDSCAQPPLAEYLEREASYQCQLTKSEDHRNALRAFIERRDPAFMGR